MRKIFVSLLTATCLLSPINVSAACQHVWSDWEIVSEATCDLPGIKSRECTKCFEYQEIELPATGIHEWGSWHEYIEPGCFAKGKEIRECQNCFETQTRDIPAIGSHQWGRWETVVSPNCMNTGKAIRICKRCDKVESKRLPKDSKKHEYGQWYVSKKATAFSKGVKQRDCYICQHSQKASIPQIKSATARTKPEKEALKTVSNFFAYSKKYDIRKLRTCLGPKVNIHYFNNKSMANLAKKYNQKHLKYSARSIKVSGNKAIIKVYCQYRNYNDVFLKAFTNLYNYSDIYTATEKQVQSRYYREITKCLKNVKSVLEYKTITFNLTKTAGKWKISKYSSVLDDAINMGYMSFAKSFGLDL